MTTLIESNIQFQFKDGLEVLKLDETNFYKNRFIALQGSKGVDFIVRDIGSKVFYLIEVKNFAGHEIENKDRLRVNTEHSLALETSLKVRDSLSCLLGAYKYGNPEITPYFEHIRNANVEIRVILFLEGRFHDQVKTFKALTDEMKVRLKWLTTKVFVENVDSAKNTIYTPTRLAAR